MFQFKPDTPKDLDSLLTLSDHWPEDNWSGGGLYSGYLDTTAFAEGAGQYQIKIEVYDKNGNLVNPYGTTPQFQFIVPDNHPDSLEVATETVVAPGKYHENAGGCGFVFNLKIDNRPCSASIDLPMIVGIVLTEEDCEENTCVSAAFAEPLCIPRQQTDGSVFPVMMLLIFALLPWFSMTRTSKMAEKQWVDR